MGIFNNKGTDIDYTLLQKKGFIKKKEEPKSPYKVNSQGMIDLTQGPALSEKPILNNNQNDTQSPFGFLDNLAQIASNNNSSIYPENNNTSNQNNENNGSIIAMKNKVDDLEFKLERLMEKLSLIESKLDGFEKKVFN
jgi:hypothetical protein